VFSSEIAFEHMSSMLAACITATTAFLVINAARLGLDTLGLVVWLTPTLIVVPATPSLSWRGSARRRRRADHLSCQPGVLRAARRAPLHVDQRQFL
jgi:hypothetical protein